MPSNPRSRSSEASVPPVPRPPPEPEDAASPSGPWRECAAAASLCADLLLPSFDDAPDDASAA